MKDSSLVAGPTGRLYVLAREVGEVCGLSVLALDTRFRPDGWACPRDFRLNSQGALLFALESLPSLADALQAAGEVDAALRLREWAARQLAAARAEAGKDFDAGQTAVAPQRDAGPCCGGEHARGPAARVDSTEPLAQGKRSWATVWEEAHQ